MVFHSPPLSSCMALESKSSKFCKLSMTAGRWLVRQSSISSVSILISHNTERWLGMS